MGPTLLGVHGFDPEVAPLADAIVAYVLERIRSEAPLDGTASLSQLDALVGPTITAEGLGGLEALRRFAEVLAPATISQDFPRHLSFVPNAPTEASVLFDLVVSASSMFGGSWLEAAGAVYAENAALRWVADLVGLPEGAGGVFVSGGSAANLSALVAARHQAAQGRERPTRWRIAASDAAHSSIRMTASVMDIDVVSVPVDDRGRLTGEALEPVLSADTDKSIFAVVATAGTTNAGIVDNLRSVGQAAHAHGAWYHVDGAYGGAALASTRLRSLFDGIEQCDSFVVDPHKWFFAPFDCAALLYRDPAIARAAHTQKAEYLDAQTQRDEWNPSEYAYHLSRRARGLPFWFSLATHGTDAYRHAVDITVDVAFGAGDLIEQADHTELVRPVGLSVVLFRRVGWTKDDYEAWSNAMLEQQVCFVVPTTWLGETVLRFCVVNPRTSLDDIALILDTLK